MKASYKLISVITVAGIFGCSQFSSKNYEEVYSQKRIPSSSDESSYIEVINSQYSKLGVIGHKLSFTDKLANTLDTGAKVGKLFEYARTQPQALFEEMRAHNDGIFQLAGSGKVSAIYLVSKNKLVKEILEHNQVFTVEEPYGVKMDKTVGPFMLGHEEKLKNPKRKEHMIHFREEKRKMRGSIYESGNDLEKVREITREVFLRAKNSIKNNKNPTHMDIVKLVTRAVPIRVVQKYFGFEAPTRSMLRWSRRTQHSFFHNGVGDPLTKREINRFSVGAGKEMKRFLREFIPLVEKEIKEGKRPHHTHTDTVTTMLRAHAKYGLDSTRVATNIMGLLVGAVETSNAAIVQSLDFIFDNPKIYDQAVAAAKSGDDALLSKIVWEALRFNPVNPWVARYSVKEHKLTNGHIIKKNSLILAATESAMFDEDVFKEPLKFSTERNHNEYFHLGFGRHRCLGDDVAMAMVPETIKQILLLPNVRRATAGEGPDFKGGPFPESWVVRWGDVKKRSIIPFLPKKIRENTWIPRVLHYSLKKIFEARDEFGTEISETFSLLKEGVKEEDEAKKKAGVIKFSRTAKTALDTMATPGELKEACMDVNELSHKVFPNIYTRAKYCNVRIDFRFCYAFGVKLLKYTPEKSYNLCVKEGFLTADEINLFKENFQGHKSFRFLDR